jgi:hypothetical protein
MPLSERRQFHCQWSRQYLLTTIRTSLLRSPTSRDNLVSDRQLYPRDVYLKCLQRCLATHLSHIRMRCRCSNRTGHPAITAALSLHRPSGSSRSRACCTAYRPGKIRTIIRTRRFDHFVKKSPPCNNTCRRHDIVSTPHKAR